MNPNTLIKLLEVDDPDVERYMKGVVPPDPTLWDMDEALHSRGFQFREYDGTPPVLVNRWIYQRGEEYWVVTPLGQDEVSYNIQCWRADRLIHNMTSTLRNVVEFFDRERKA